MNARYNGACREPDGYSGLCGLTNGQPGCGDYYAQQNAKLKKYRLGLPAGQEAEAVDAHQTNGGCHVGNGAANSRLLQTLAPAGAGLPAGTLGSLVDAGVPVSRVQTTLDITAAVVQEAVENVPADCQPPPGDL